MTGAVRAKGTNRLMYIEARGQTGEYYGYYMCRGRQKRTCDLPYLPVHLVEEAVAQHYRTICLSDEFIRDLEELTAAVLADEQQLIHERHGQLAKQLTKLEAREERPSTLPPMGFSLAPRSWNAATGSKWSEAASKLA